MGLDMYLTKKTYVGAEYKHRKVTGKVIIKVDGELLPIQFDRISEICERVGYWRKANHIHQWFIENVQDGVDNCGEYEVSYAQLVQLAEACKAVVNKPEVAADTLPRQPGFFFGGTDYDEYYLKQTQDTLDIITPLLAEAKEYQGEKYMPETIYYQSSW